MNLAVLLSRSSAVLAFSMLPLTQAVAQPPEDNGTMSVDDDRSGLLQRTIEELELERTWEWLEERRDNLSRRVTVVGRNLDDWLAGEAVGGRANESHIRLRLNQRIGRFNTYHSTARISGRIDLPRASERWKLIFETESDEQRSLRDQRLENMNSSSFIGGFRYELPERNGWRFSHDVGLDSSIPVDPFYRFRVRYGADLNEDWYIGLNSRTFYYHHDGLGQDTRLFFSRTITDQLNFRVESEVNYRHNERLTEFGQSMALHQDLGYRETMTYELGLIGRNRPRASIDNYYAQMVYRKAIYEDWLIMELIPQLLFENRYDWKPDPRVLLNLEIYFFENSGR